MQIWKIISEISQWANMQLPAWWRARSVAAIGVQGFELSDPGLVGSNPGTYGRVLGGGFGVQEW
jgi:hypothetical protein